MKKNLEILQKVRETLFFSDQDLWEGGNNQQLMNEAEYLMKNYGDQTAVGRGR